MKEETKENIKWFFIGLFSLGIGIIKDVAIIYPVAKLVFWIFNLNVTLKLLIAMYIVYFIYILIYGFIQAYIDY